MYIHNAGKYREIDRRPSHGCWLRRTRTRTRTGWWWRKRRKRTSRTLVKTMKLRSVAELLEGGELEARRRGSPICASGRFRKRLPGRIHFIWSWCCLGKVLEVYSALYSSALKLSFPHQPHHPLLLNILFLRAIIIKSRFDNLWWFWILDHLNDLNYWTFSYWI